MEDDSMKLRILVDGREVELASAKPSGRDVLTAVGGDPESRDVLIRIDGGRARLIAPGDPIVGVVGEAHFRLHRNATLRHLRVDGVVWEWGAPGIQEHDIRGIAGIADERRLFQGGNVLRAGEVVDLTVDWVPKIESRPEMAGALTVPIVVNGSRQSLAVPEVSFEDLVGIAYPDVPAISNSMFTVTYRHGPLDRPEGSLAPTQRLRAVNGAVFNVTATNKS
ncbi:multiubiquitin domain-containing protein [Sphingobium sp. HWE2-09]|uniref:multiubiquitin domain-containing protein n=1 Tax=Sphingobium sp. HWE2-09 TaxID=3108390 RepID=UPI002DC3624C|nr:multiubiquitin domain-containing protein [Sphingobium sp. HWE2-09]